MLGIGGSRGVARWLSQHTEKNLKPLIKIILKVFPPENYSKTSETLFDNFCVPQNFATLSLKSSFSLLTLDNLLQQQLSQIEKHSKRSTILKRLKIWHVTSEVNRNVNHK